MKAKGILIMISLALGSFNASAQKTITVNGNDTGRTFEGIGMLSAGASSRLLVDYPEPYRSDILDFLFKPGFGANLYQLKVENGGDINSTDGAELSYAHTRSEFLHPKAAYFNRGYEWWLIKEAKKRNPHIRIEILQWGAPGWIGNGKFYSRDNAKFIAEYIKGLKKYHGIDVDYTGIRNEVMFDTGWIKLLRRTLDSSGLSQVKIDVGDQWKPGDQWKIAGEITRDPELNKDIYALNAHVPELTHFYTPAAAQKINKPLWSGESHVRGGDWYAAAKAAGINNRSYPVAKITKVIYWSLITSYPDYLTAPGSGIMKANTPWSGNYSVQPPLWMAAHINQFAKPGWKYMDGGCKCFPDQGWSVISLKDTATGDYSIIIETMDAKEDHTVRFKLSGGLSTKPLAVWESAFKQFLFKRQADIIPLQNEFTLTVKPNTIYSLTTTRGHHKGKAAHPIPPPAPFPKVYEDNFDRDSLQREPPFFLNYHGAFEVVTGKRAGNRYLRQCSLQQGINWFHQPYPRILLGDSAWKDTKMSVDFRLPDTGMVRVESRLHHFAWNSKVPGYCFQIRGDGEWELKLAGKGTILQRGKFQNLARKWHRLQFNCVGDRLTVLIDEKKIADARDSTYKSGVAALGSGWNVACFDNFKIDAR
ncbi:MAG TPA: hypothetical protein VFX43_05735 [Chitinophagaceae bacterium]|nr:hypothetical protein [Chitinophagaceae bacterium]